MTVIAHISDLHTSQSEFDEEIFMQAVSEINHLQPDMIVLTGDLTNNGYYVEFEQAKKYLEMFEAPLFAVPGNHDARNLGYQTFEELIGEKSWKLTMGDDFTVIGLDSSSPDENRGHIGNPQHMWLEHQLDECVINENFAIVALHHHVISIPQTGRERNVLSDAGDILKTLTTHEVDLVPNYADKVFVLVDGKLIGEGTPKEIFAQPEILEKANLKVPIVTELFQQLEAEQGFDMQGDYPLTIEEAKDKFLKLLNKN